MTELSDTPAATLEEFATWQLRPAMMILRGRGEISPMMVFETPAGTGIAAVPDYGQDDAKGPLRAAMADMLKKTKATRYAFIIEAWMGHGDVSSMTPDYRPRNDPNRKEAIVVSAADDQGGKVLVISFITREPELSFSKPEISHGSFGALMDLLTKPTMN